MTSSDILRRARRLQVLAARPGSQMEVVIRGSMVWLRDSRRQAMGCSIALAVVAVLAPASAVILAHGLRATVEMYGVFGLGTLLALWSVLVVWAIAALQARRPYLQADAKNCTLVIKDLRPSVECLPMDGVSFLLLFVTIGNDGGWDDLYAVCDDGKVLYMLHEPPMPWIHIAAYLFGREILRVTSKESRALSTENLDSLQSYLKRGFTTDDRHWMARAISTGAVLDVEKLRLAGELIYDPATQESAFKVNDVETI